MFLVALNKKLRDENWFIKNKINEKQKNIKESIKISIEYVQNGIKNAPDFGSGNGPIRHF